MFESAEAFKLIESFLNTTSKHQVVDTIFDMACGHGFVGEFDSGHSKTCRLADEHITLRL
eukprot:4760655-Pyramimonas_sp.AAC.2